MYKILYNNIPIDVIKDIIYCRYISNMKRTLRSDIVSANCIVSSDGSEIYHISGTTSMPEEYKSVIVVPIEKREYDYLQSLVEKGEIPAEDLLTARVNKIAEVSEASEKTIHAGTDITLSDGNTYHFSFSDQDQFQIGFLATSAKTAQMLETMGLPTNETGKDYPWHADGGDCIFYSRQDMITIGTTMQNYITYHNSYFHALRNYIQSLTSALRIVELKYGVEVPQMYWGDVYQTIAVGEIQNG